jgi:hypothetical protein
MPDALSSIVASTLFCGRNVGKCEKGQFREPVVVGQGANALKYITTLDNSIGKGARTAVEALETLAKNEKLFDVAGKAVKLASEYVNPLICVSSGIDVLMSDDKESALITNTAALTSMFAVEGLMKKHLEEIPKMEFMKGITKGVMEFATKYKCEGKLPSIIHGVAFVVGSCTAYGLGQKFGTMVVREVKSAETGKEKAA